MTDTNIFQIKRKLVEKGEISEEEIQRAKGIREKIVRLIKESKTVSEIANLKEFLRIDVIAFTRSIRESEENENEFVEEREMISEETILDGLLLGMNMYQIASILGLKQETVKNTIKKLEESGKITKQEIEKRKNARLQIVVAVSRENDFAGVREKIDLPEKEIARMIQSVQERRIISNEQREMEVAKERKTNQTTKQEEQKQPLQITRQELMKIEKESRSCWSLQETIKLINGYIKAGYYDDAIRCINTACRELPMKPETKIKFERMKESLKSAMKKQKLQEILASQNYPQDSSSLSQRLGIPETEVIRLQRELKNNMQDELEL